MMHFSILAFSDSRDITLLLLYMCV